MAPFIVDKEEEREDSDDETADDEDNHNQSTIHLFAANIKLHDLL